MKSNRAESRKKREILFGISIAVFVSFSALAQAPGKAAVVVDDPAYAHAQRLVEIETGRRLNLYCTGTGSPTVVFDSGLTEETTAWAVVQPVVSKKTQACSYDRAGIGFSDPSPRNGSSEVIADDLRRLLQAASIKPPFILVGHSYGGLNVTYFASRYPEEVAGMVLVDPTPADIINGYRSLDPQWEKTVVVPWMAMLSECVAGAQNGFKPETELFQKCIGEPDSRVSDAISAARREVYLKPGYWNANKGEIGSLFLGVSGDQTKAVSRSFGQMPLIVLGTPPDPSILGYPGNPAMQEARYRLRIKLHDDLASLSSRGVHRIVPESGHSIQFDQPKAVDDAIFEVLDAVKK